MDAQTLQTFVDSLQPLFAAVFLYHAFVVRRMARVEPFVPYECIVPMSLAASAYYFLWHCYWLTTSPHLLRITAHLVWLSGVAIMYFHVGALQAYFQPCVRWISHLRRVLAFLQIPVAASLVMLIVSGKMFFLSSNPMPHPPLAFPLAIRERIQNAFSGNALVAIIGTAMIAFELSCFSYFLYKLVKRRGDRWLMFGLALTLVAIINEVVAGMRTDSYAISFFFVAIFVEIVRLTALTERANRERMLRVQNSMRLAQIGEMTATVAHELVNPLAIIIGNTDMALKTESVDATQMRKILERIQDSATRMLSIVRGLRDHARQVETENERIDVEKTLNEIIDMILPIHTRDGVQLELDIPAGLPFLIGNKGKLQQILLNLLQNASDATEGCEPRKVSLTACYQDDRLQIKVQDNGCGIPQEHLAKIFTPFFTTKPRGKGTGIGLSFVDSQVRLMKGSVRVFSEPGNTIFTLLFPAGND